MTPVSIDPKSVEAALADPAFAALNAGPVIVIGGSPAGVVYASEQALALFSARSADELTRRLLDGREPGARRLTDLAANLPPGAPRLERLRFYVGGGSEAITFQCKRLPGAAPFIVAAAIAVRPALLAAAPLKDSVQEESPAAQEPAPAPVEAPLSGAVRFLWKSDAELRFTSFDEAGCKALGCDPAALAGTSVLELAGLPGFDPEGRLCAALMRRETWSGVEVNWPIGDTNGVAPVVMGALPTFDKDRTFAGFSGFGVIHLDRVTQRPAPSNDELAADIAAETGMDTSARDDQAAADMAEIAALIKDAARIGMQAPGDEESPSSEADEEIASGVAAERESPSSGDVEPEPRDAGKTARTGPAGEPFKAPNVVALNAWKNGGNGQPAAAPTPPPAAPSTPGSSESAGAGDEFPSVEGEEEELVRLTPAERHAFREIARALGARIEDAEKRRARHDQRSADAKEKDQTAREPQAPNEMLAPASGDSDSVPQKTPVLAASAPGNEDATRRLLDRIEAGLMICREGEAVYLNKTLLDTLGYADFDAFTAAGGLARMFRGRTPEAAASSGAVPVARADGEIIALEGRLTTIEWDGAPALLTTFRRPGETELATRVRALELDLRAREIEGRELHAILDTATDGVAILDGDGRILGLNRSAEALFGYEQNEVAGDSFTILFATDSHPAAIDYLSGLKTNGVRSVLNDGREVLGRARQGGVIPIFMTIGRIGAEPASKFCVVMRDMTQWKNAERELKDARRDAEEASALKSDFLAKISHEIRTPLNAILGFAEVILEERFGPIANERYKDYLKDIHASGTHVMSLVNDLLDLSKIEAGKLELTFGSVDANRIINECVSMMQAQAIRDRVIIRLSLAPRFPNIVADERALRQIVLNLLSNAVKFNQPGGQVIVSTALTDSGAAVIRVRDNGVGMTDKEVETALEPFRQIQTSRHTAGTGLGLPLTKALVEANRAAFTIRSRKGEGTLVEVSFPSTRVLAE
ncbi:MAG: PAS domain-containing sensor histidine kinase [Beijerinckiaceae bacterium]